MESLTADYAKGKDSAASFGNAEIRAFQLNEQAQLSADAATIDGLNLFIKRSLLEAVLRWYGVDVEESGSRPDAITETAGTSPEPVLQEADVNRVQTLLAELGYDPGPVDGRSGQRTVTAVKAFQKRERLTVDGRLTESLLAALEARAAEPTVENRDPGGSRVRLGQLALTGKSRIRFQDDIVKPPVAIDAVINEAQIQNLDTQKTDQRTDVRIVVGVNEFTNLELSGWVKGVNENADLELDAKIENLELSTYSPYIRKLAAVHLESGQLDTTVSGKAGQGSLQGKIRIGVDDIAFRPLSKQEAEQMTETMGVPLETAVDLLQDNKGHIGLELPVSGTINQPDVDISSAVNQAIGGALKKVFPPTMIASMLSNAEKGAGPAFQPIEFQPGSAELDAAAKSYADDLSELLAERPKLSLNVCSRLTRQDLDELMAPDETAASSSGSDDKGQAGPTESKAEPLSAEASQALSELATERQRVVRRYLVQDKGATAKRVGECRPKLEIDDQGTPRVEVSLKR
jgi:peptidoglycan hydrolase-like protein with peptidoglycan-binding domain